MSRFVTAPFDDLNRNFMHIRRVSDIYEWGNRVLLPGLFWGAPPCNESGVGVLPVFNSSLKACNAEVYVDGEGALARRSPALV